MSRRRRTVSKDSGSLVQETIVHLSSTEWVLAIIQQLNGR